MDQLDGGSGWRFRITVSERGRSRWWWITIEEVPPFGPCGRRRNLGRLERFALNLRPATMNRIRNRNDGCFFERERRMNPRKPARLRREIHQIFSLAREIHRLRFNQILIEKECVAEFRQSVALQRRAVQGD